MSFQTFFREIEKGFTLPVYLLYTADLFLHREAIDAIKRLVPESERDFNLHIYEISSSGDENPPLERILDVANTVSFFGGRRFTILAGNIQKLSKNDFKRLNDYVSDPAPGSLFVMIHDGSLKKEMRERFRGLKPISIDIRESEIPDWLRQRAGRNGLNISGETAEYLIGLVGPDLGLLSAEIEKISLLGKKKIGIDDISEIIAGGRLYSVFDLVGALQERDSEEVFRIYKMLKDSTDDYNLIGALNWQYSRNLPGNRAENEYFSRLFGLLNMADIDIKSSGRTFPMEYLLAKLLRLRRDPPEAEGHSPFW